MKSSEEKSSVKILNQNPVKTPISPDGGYGWVIVAASFMCNVIVYGIAKSYGIFLVHFIDYYQTSKAELAWIGSLFIGCMLISGPLGGALINGFGSRPVIIAGSLLSSISFLLSTVAPTVRILVFTYGIMGGIGFGLINIPAVVNVSLYFSSKRALATGIAMCGIGIGSFIIPSLTTLLLEYYDWKGTLIILSGLVLNCIVFGSVMKPLPQNSTNEKPKMLRSNIIETEDSFHHQEFIKHQYGTPTTSDIKNESGKHFIPHEYHSTHCNELHAHNSGNTLDNIGLSATSELCAQQPLHELLSEKAIQIKDRYHYSSLTNNFQNDDNTSNLVDTKYSKTDHDVERCLTSVAVINSCKVSSLRNFRPHTKLSSTNFVPLFKTVANTLTETFNVSILQEKPFLLLCMSSVIVMMGLLVPYVFLPHNSVMKGIDWEKASFLLSVIGIADLSGRLTFGYIADRPKIRSLDVNNVCVYVSGIASLAIPFCFSYSSIMLVGILYGFFAAGHQCLPSILSVDIVGLEKLTNSYGLVCLFRGIGCIIGSPIAGAMFDGTGNYDLLFYTAGAFLILSASLTMFIPCVMHHQKNVKALVSKDFSTLADRDNNPITSK